MKINMNTIVKVKLTEYGKKWFEENESPSFFKYDGETLEVELWLLGQVFGDSFLVGNPEVPFVNNEIEIKEVKNETKEVSKENERRRDM